MHAITSDRDPTAAILRIDLPPSNLPMPSDSFRGRDDLCARCAVDVEGGQAKFLTVIGPPGAGKRGSPASWESGTHSVWRTSRYAVDLTAVADPGLVAATISRALRLRRRRTRSGCAQGIFPRPPGADHPGQFRPGRFSCVCGC